MRAVWRFGAAIAAMSLTIAGCSSILGDFTIAPGNGLEDAGGTDGSLTDDGNVGQDSTTPAEDGVAANDGAAGTLGISPLSHDFTSVLVGASSGPQIFTVSNTGAAVTGVLSVSVIPGSGTSSAEFPATDGCTGATLAPNATCTLTLVMSPATGGAKSASLQVTASPGGTVNASLTGTGTAPAALGVSPSLYAFSTTTAGTDAGPTETFTVTNSGTVASSVLTTSLLIGAGTASSEFAITSDGCSGKSLGGSQTCGVVVQFEPATYGAKGATLAINGGPPSATITGTGEDFPSLTVVTSGIGAGTVTDGTSAISCPSTCSASFSRKAADPVVTLTATPAATSTFEGWNGSGCSGTGTCQVTLSAASTQVTAQFTCSICNTACTNEQTDPANCGACGHGCLGGTCTNGACDPFDFYTPSDVTPEGITADSTYVYWINNVGDGYGTVEVCSLASGSCASPTAFIATTPNATSGIPSATGLGEGGGLIAAVGGGISDGTSTGGARAESCGAEVGSPPVTCTPAVEISNGGGTGDDYFRVATDGTNIAVLAYQGVSLLEVGQTSENYAAATQAYVASGANLVGSVAIGVTAGASYVYWTVLEEDGTAGTDSHEIFRCEIGGGTYPCSTTTTPLAPQLVYNGGTTYRNPGPIVFDATTQTLYWLDEGSTPNPPPNTTNGSLLTCSIATLPCVPTVLAAGLSGPVDMAEDATTIYFGTEETIQSCAKAGCNGSPTTLASGEFGVMFVAADTSPTGSVFWTTGQAVRRVAK